MSSTDSAVALLPLLRLLLLLLLLLLLRLLLLLLLRNITAVAFEGGPHGVHVRSARRTGLHVRQRTPAAARSAFMGPAAVQ